MIRSKTAFAVVAIVLGTSLCEAQFRRTTAQLGSEGPSQFVGTIGGGNTGYVPTVSGSRRLDTPYSGMPRFTAAGGRGGSLGRGTAIFRRPGLGFGQGNASSRFAGIRRGMVNEWDLRDVSYLTLATSFNEARGLVMSPDTTRVRTPLFLEEPKSAYHAYFGLVPAESEVRPPERGPDEHTIAARMERLAESSESQRMKNAERAFREATMTEQPNRVEKLAQTMTILSNVRHASGNPEAMLMFACAAIMREQTIMASNYLLEVALSKPETFAEMPDLWGHCADPSVLEEALRKLMMRDFRLATAPEDAVSQAFCALLLKDRARAKAALDEAERRFVGRPYESRVRLFAQAVQYALDEQE